MILRTLLYRCVAFMTVLLVALGAIAAPAHAFNQRDVAKFLWSRTCFECDLTGANLTGADLTDAIR